MKILLVEDDDRLASLVSEFLTQNDFDVIHVARGDLVMDNVARHCPDLIILDIMLPGLDGFTLCKTLRPKFTGPILLLTARNSDFDQVLGLELGADDYVIKPVEPRVLLARVSALLRRYDHDKPTDNTDLSFGQLTIAKRSREVTLAGETIDLTSHEFELLAFLAEHAGQAQSREHIHKVVIGREYDGLDRSIDVRISRLRKKLHDNSESPFRLKTIWGKGYLFVPDAWGSQ